jgi:hypothetical protein
MAWQKRFDRLLKAMSEGEPHKAEKRQRKVADGRDQPPPTRDHPQDSR